MNVFVNAKWNDAKTSCTEQTKQHWYAICRRKVHRIERVGGFWTTVKVPKKKLHSISYHVTNYRYKLESMQKLNRLCTTNTARRWTLQDKETSPLQHSSNKSGNVLMVSPEVATINLRSRFPVASATTENHIVVVTQWIINPLSLASLNWPLYLNPR